MSSVMGPKVRNRVPRMAEAAVERARLSVVPRPGQRRAGRVPFVALICLVLVAGVAGLLYLNTTMQQVSFKATALEQRADALDARRQALQMDLDSRRDSQRLARAAKQLGMVPPAGPVFISLGSGKVTGTPTPASWADSFRLDPKPTKAPARKTRYRFMTPSGAGGARDDADAGTKKSRQAPR